VLRDAHGRVERVIEAQDATDEELAIEERNTGVYLVSAPLLREGLENIDAHNQQGELYITDVVGYAVAKGHVVEALWLRDGTECLGINTRAELANVASIMRERINARLMSSGVTLIDPDNTYIDADVQIGRDTIIEPGCHITGRSVIGEAVHIKAGCYIEDSRLDDRVIFGPFSHLRPNCHLMRGVKIGNFVEVKNSTIGEGSKSAHLTYIGDADVGAGVNFGCGSVVVNYDGYEKHRTVVGDEAFVGCNVNLLSPVEIEPKAFLAAGSTISQRVPTDALGVARARQRNIEGWVARKEGRAAPRSRSGAGSAVHANSGGTERVVAKPSAGSKPGGKKKVTNVKKKGTKKKAAKGRLAKKKATKKKATKKKVAKKGVAKKKVAKKKAAKKGTVKKKAVRRELAKKRRR
jgi:bifunctional UDP-N-acetylglucosamine pyrophosphorylase/glucosamine-1-phosphate N-acetyltransferase